MTAYIRAFVSEQLYADVHMSICIHVSMLKICKANSYICINVLIICIYTGMYSNSYHMHMNNRYHVYKLTNGAQEIRPCAQTFVCVCVNVCMYV